MFTMQKTIENEKKFCWSINHITKTANAWYIRIPKGIASEVLKKKPPFLVYLIPWEG